jgi:colanic acid/amylovoran biosynthesis protein
MRIVVTHVYSRNNKGDSAILSCQLRELRRVFPGATLEVFTLERVGDGETFEGLPLQRSLMSTVVGGGAPRPLRPLLGALMVGSTLAWAAVQRATGLAAPLPAGWRAAVEALQRCDAQVCVGGGYLRGNQSLNSSYALMLLLHQIALGRMLGKPVYLYAQSFGPFPGPGQERLFRWVTPHTSMILPRESISHDLVQQIAGGRTRIERVIDSAFLLEKPAKASLDAWFPAGRPPVVVGLTAREWLKGQKQLDYEKALGDLIDHILAKGWGVMLIPQVTAKRDDDRVVGRRLSEGRSQLPGFVHVEDELPHDTISSLYASLDLLVGTRFHSVIFSLCAGIPCLAIEYEHKTSGILRDLGLGDWYLPIEDVTTPLLVAGFERLVAEQHTLKPVIEQAVRKARHQAERGADLIADHYRALTDSPA